LSGSLNRSSGQQSAFGERRRKERPLAPVHQRENCHGASNQMGSFIDRLFFTEL